MESKFKIGDNIIVISLVSSYTIEAVNRRKIGDTIQWYYTVSDTFKGIKRYREVEENNLMLVEDFDKKLKYYTTNQLIDVFPQKESELIIFPDNSKFDLNNLGFTQEELYFIYRKLDHRYNSDNVNYIANKLRILFVALSLKKEVKDCENEIKKLIEKDSFFADYNLKYKQYEITNEQVYNITQNRS